MIKLINQPNHLEIELEVLLIKKLFKSTIFNRSTKIVKKIKLKKMNKNY